MATRTGAEAPREGSVTGRFPPPGAGPPRAPRSITAPSAARQPPALRWLIAAGCLAVGIVLVAAASAYAVASRKAKVYGARAELVYQVDPTADRDAAIRQLATEVVTIQSRAVLEPVASAEGLGV